MVDPETHPEFALVSIYYWYILNYFHIFILEPLWTVTSLLHMAHLLSWTNYVFCRTRLRIHRYVAASFLRTRPFFNIKKWPGTKNKLKMPQQKFFMKAKTTILKRRWLSLKCSKPMPGSSMALVSSIQSLPETESHMQSCWYGTSPETFYPRTQRPRITVEVRSMKWYLLWHHSIRSEWANLLSKDLELLYSKIRRIDRCLSYTGIAVFIIGLVWTPAQFCGSGSGILDPMSFWPLDLGSGAFLNPGSGIRCLFDPWIRDPGWVKIRSRIRMSIPDHISESLETFFWGLNTSILWCGSGMEKIRIRDVRIRDKHPVYGTLTGCLFSLNKLS
jgi:hypothetical protein